ncbi:MAG: dolichol-phosphate mannosyltransferase subunit 3 [Planctomycetaceae bacterium]|nr:dolichol-phosphate mannosyltransferase subunit 3 [Planctomycetaceae bacterium]
MIPQMTRYAQWLIIALAAGVGLVAVTCLTFVMLKRPRVMRDGEIDTQTGWRSVARYMPWVLILTYGGMLLYGLIYAVIRFISPPNW